jgi:predicted enzyme related to lactoylglutathione lyase
MSEESDGKTGRIGWVDLTVDDADRVRDFYREVVGWGAAPLDMGGYSDYVMTEPGKGEPVAGVCHARGSNAGLPPVWLVYLTVADLDQSIAKCVELGGEVLVPTKGYGRQGRYCVIRDPAGAVAALYQETSR